MHPNPKRRTKRSDKLREQERPTVLGFELDRETLTPVRYEALRTGGDYGADPLGEIDGEFKWRMVPSGDIVGRDEHDRRLKDSVVFRRRNGVGAFLGGALVGAAGLGVAQYAMRRTSGQVRDLKYKIGPSVGREYWIDIESPEGFAFAETTASSPQNAEQDLLQWIARNEPELRRWLPERRKIFQVKQQNPKRGRKAKRSKQGELRQDWIEAPQGLIVDELYLARAYARARAEHFGRSQAIHQHHAQQRWDIGPVAPLDRATWDFVEVVQPRAANPRGPQRRSTSMSPATYVVYAGFKEPVGLLRYGGKHYYSDSPPWLGPVDLARDLYRKKDPRSKYRLVDEDSASDEEWERATENQRSGKYAAVRPGRNPNPAQSLARRLGNP